MTKDSVTALILIAAIASCNFYMKWGAHTARLIEDGTGGVNTAVIWIQFAACFPLCLSLSLSPVFMLFFYFVQ